MTAIQPKGVEAVTAAIARGVSSGVAAGVTSSRNLTPYDFLKVDVPLTLGPEVIERRGLAYRMVSDPRTRFHYPRLTRHTDPEVLARTNHLLEQRHWAMTLMALACAATRYTHTGSAAGSLGQYEEESIEIAYLSAHLMTVIESGSTDCGGAHPNNHFEPYTLDLDKGGYFDFSRLLMGLSYHEYRHEYSPQLMSFIRQQLKKADAAGASVGSAPNAAQTDAISCTDMWPEYLYLHFERPDQLAFAVSGVGHALGACLGTHLTVPFAALQPVLKPQAKTYLGLR